jgi:hypothetical protein
LLPKRRFFGSFDLMLAHIAGIPVEESLPWLVPIGGLGLAAAAAWGRGQARSIRRRFASRAEGKEVGR